MSPRIMAQFNTTFTTTRAALRVPASLGVGLLVNSLMWLVLGCSGKHATAPGSFGDTPAAMQESDKGNFDIALYSSPTNVPVRGENHVRLELTHDNDEDVAVTPTLVTFMPAMGHGSGIVPKLTEVTGELYTFEHVVLNMPGRWELRLELETEDRDGAIKVDNAVFEFDVD